MPTELAGAHGRDPASPANEVVRPYYQQAIGEGIGPDAVADLVADAIDSDRFWILPHPEFVELAVHRWHRIAEGANPDAEVDVPGFPPTAQWTSEIRSALIAPTT